jgi:hypothetical protein
VSVPNQPFPLLTVLGREASGTVEQAGPLSVTSVRANGTLGDQVPGTWSKARASNSSGACVEAAALPGGEVAARNSRHPSGWAGFSDVLPAWFETYLGVEDLASVIRAFDLQFACGLFQTEDYARAVTVLGHRDARAGDGRPSNDIPERAGEPPSSRPPTTPASRTPPGSMTIGWADISIGYEGRSPSR